MASQTAGQIPTILIVDYFQEATAGCRFIAGWLARSIMNRRSLFWISPVDRLGCGLQTICCNGAPMRRDNLLALLVSLGITGLLISGMAYFISEWWGRLPKVVALILFILLAVRVIGYPIYALARWSDQYLAQVQEAQRQGRKEPPE
jgi:CHASE2 domain-containing sensor protein